ncbi:hypothetical protein PybrP1_000417 [[Pythium] brassicae (nom. inval.)]|nr:hypothetical protein PybrP1_000417 [[Pythium] brassicae (nom. inval.)]
MTLRSGSGNGTSVAAPTSLTQWNNLQQQNAELVDLSKLIESVRTALRSGGVLAWVTLGLNLEKAFTQSENAGLGKGSVKRVFNDSNVPLSDVDARAIVKHIANDDHARVSPDAIKNLVCGALTGRRLDLVQSVFEQLDRKRLGYISYQDVVATHDAHKHPSVMFGEKSAEQVQEEFQTSFQTATRSGGSSFVNLYQWMSYFQYICGHVPSDEYFELLLKRVWKATSRTSLSEAAAAGSSLQRLPSLSGVGDSGAAMTLMQALEESNPAMASSYSKGPSLSVSTALAYSVPSRLHRSNSTTSTSDGASPRAVHSTTEFLKGSQFAACMVDPSIHTPSPSHTSSYLRRISASSPQASGPSGGRQVAVDAGTTSVLNRLRSGIKERGLRGLVELSRSIRLSDGDSDGFLTLAQFKRAVGQLNNVQLSDVDMRCLFSHLDTERRGSVPLHAVLDLIREPMNYRRFQLVLAAFQSVDRDGSGKLEPSEIVQAYDSTKHPEVISGRKSEEDVFHEFLESFDVESAGAGESGKISFPQWEQYYQNVSFFVADDDFFDLMVRNTWQLMHLEVDDDLGSPALSGAADSAPSSPRANPNAAYRVVRGSGHGSSQAFAILQPDLSDRPQRHGPGGAPVNSSLPGCMFAANKQTKELRRIISQLRAALKDQGVVGFISLQRKFRLMDDDQNGSISLPEFQKALKECKLHLAPQDTTSLFQYFDANHDGAVDFTEFLSGVREPMSDRRMLFVRMAFDIIDKDSNGVLEVSDIIDVYDARKHPEVVTGRKTEHDVFAEFIETFDVDQLHDGKVTFDEWTRYYHNISASIDDDDYFELMMRNAWHISGGAGWSANSANRRVLVTLADGTTSVQEVKNDLGVKREDVARVLAKQLGLQQPARTSFYDILDHTSAQASSGAPDRRRTKGNSSESLTACLTMPASTPEATQSRGSFSSISATTPGVAASVPDKAMPNSKHEHPVGVQLILSKLKAGLKAKGAHGFCGLSRKFRIMDDDGNGSLNAGEFRKAVSELELELSDADARLLFQYFDRDRSGSIDLNEFLAGVRDPLNDRRVFFVREAFRLMDKDGNGLLEPSDIVEAYDASRHPDVLSGRKAPETVCREFLETFDVDGVHNGKITWDQWLHYYQNVSASIDDDDYFELMMRNAWHISGGTGWSANSTTRRVLVTLADGSDIVREVKNDLGVTMQHVHARLQAQDQFAEGTDSSIARVGGSSASLNLTDPPGVSAGKRILTLREASSAAPMAMPPAAGAHSQSPSTPSSGSLPSVQGDTVFHMIRYRIRQKRVTDVVQLRKRALQYIDAKTGTITARHCCECFNAALGLTLSEESCVALFAFVNQLPEARAFDLSSSGATRNQVVGASSAAASSTIGARFVQSSLTSVNRMPLRKLFHCVLGGGLSPACAEAARRVFGALQSAGRGRVFPVALARSFEAAQHPEVQLGGATASAVFHEFAASLEVPAGDGDGAVAFEHFESYCAHLRATLGSDELLQVLLRDCFRVV